MRKAIIELTLFQALFVTTWLIVRTAPWFFVTLGIIVLACAGITIYLLVRWRRLPVADRWQGVFAVVGWMVVAYIILHANGLTVRSLWGW